MLIKIFTFGFDEIRGAFDDAELTVFVQANQIASVRDYLVTKGGQPYLTLVIAYHPLDSEETVSSYPPNPPHLASPSHLC